MLKQCLASILGQSYKDFEIVVGNDYIPCPVSETQLGIRDDRIRILNHPQNLGEVPNMNELLKQARGRYFTWLGDDDLFAPVVLQAVREALNSFDALPVVFTSYAKGKSPQELLSHFDGKPQVMAGGEFLRSFLSRQLKTVGCYGFFETSFLREIGGIQRLGKGFSPYADNLLAIRSGILEKVVYLDAPLVFFRTHEASLSTISTGMSAYTTAQEDLLRESMIIFRHERLRGDLCLYLFLLLEWCRRDVYCVVCRGKRFPWQEFACHLSLVGRHLPLLGRYAPRFVYHLLRGLLQMIREIYLVR